MNQYETAVPVTTIILLYSYKNMIYFVVTGCSPNSLNISIATQPAILSYPVTIKFNANAPDANVAWFYGSSLYPLKNERRTRQYGDDDGYYYLQISNTTHSDQTIYRAMINNSYYCDIELYLKRR